MSDETNDNFIVRFIAWIGSLIKGMGYLAILIILLPIILLLLGYLFLLIRWLMNFKCTKCEECKDKK